MMSPSMGRMIFIAHLQLFLDAPAAPQGGSPIQIPHHSAGFGPAPLPHFSPSFPQVPQFAVIPVTAPCVSFDKLNRSFNAESSLLVSRAHIRDGGALKLSASGAVGIQLVSGGR